MKNKHFALALVGLLFAMGAVFAAETEPRAPEKLVLKDGRVVVEIGTPRVSDYQINDSMMIRVVFTLTPDSLYKKLQKAPIEVMPKTATVTAPAKDTAPVLVPNVLDMPKIDIENLKAGMITNATDAEFRVLKPAVIVEGMRPDGRKLIVATFYVTTDMTTKLKQIKVKADFMYAIANLPHGQPDWISTSTSELVIGVVRSADEKQTLLIDGDLKPKAAPMPTAAIILLIVAGLLALPMLVSLGVLWYRRATSLAELSDNEKMWVKVDAIVQNGEKAGFSLQHYKAIFYEIRQRLNVLGLDTNQTLETLSKDAKLDRNAVEQVFNRETVFFDPNQVITSDRHSRLMASIQVLIPRK